jgi:WD40 repeat protein
VIVYSPDGEYIATGGQDATIRLWDAELKEQIRRLDGHLAPVVALAFSPDGAQLVSGSEDGSVKAWDAAPSADITAVRADKQGVKALARSHDGRHIVTGGMSGAVLLWDAAEIRVVRQLAQRDAPIKGVAFDVTDQLVFLGDRQGRLAIVSVQGDGPPRVLEPGAGEVLSVMSSPAAPIVATGHRGGPVMLWTSDAGDQLDRLPGEVLSANGLAFSPDGQRLAAAAEDGNVYVWAAPWHGPPTALCGHEGGVMSVAFSPDGRRLVSGGNDGRLNTWDVAAGTRIRTVAIAHEGWNVLFVAYSPDRSAPRIASGGWDGTIRLWDADTLDHVLTLRRHAGDARCLSWTADGGRLLSGSGEDPILRVWHSVTP